jgi:redox-sensitive bicupin YhaK (pirin superfamily)
MSNLTKQCEQECRVLTSCDAVELVVEPKEKELGGFSVRRVLPNRQRKMVGPWIFFDHMGPARFPPGEGVNVRPHPHIGIATVTYLFEGEILHRDSLGSYQAIRPGDINLMVAGSGIVHSERERAEVAREERVIHGLQLWLVLPEAQEEIAPAFYHYPSETIPSLDIDGVDVRVIMGSAYGHTSPVNVFSDTLYLEADIKAGQRLQMPSSPERAVYVAKGALQIGGTEVPQHTMAFLHGDTTVVEAKSDTRIAVVGGEPLGHRFIEWNFVSSRKERVEQAKADWQSQRFAKVPGDEDEYIPLPS